MLDLIDTIKRKNLKDKSYLLMAHEMAQLSLDPSTKVGAVIVNGRVLSTGYNGFPASLLDDPNWYANRETKYPLVIHAEVNAILYCQDREALKGATLYVTHSPCRECAKLVEAVGIRRVVTIERPEARFSTGAMNRVHWFAKQSGEDRWLDTYKIEEIIPIP